MVSHSRHLTNSEAYVLHESARNFARRLDAQVLCAQRYAVLWEAYVASRSNCVLSLHAAHSTLFGARRQSKLLNRAPQTIGTVVAEEVPEEVPEGMDPGALQEREGAEIPESWRDYSWHLVKKAGYGIYNGKSCSRASENEAFKF